MDCTWPPQASKDHDQEKVCACVTDMKEPEDPNISCTDAKETNYAEPGDSAKKYVCCLWPGCIKLFPNNTELGNHLDWHWEDSFTTEQVHQFADLRDGFCGFAHQSTYAFSGLLTARFQIRSQARQTFLLHHRNNRCVSSTSSSAKLPVSPQPPQKGFRVTSTTDAHIELETHLSASSTTRAAHYSSHLRVS